MISPWLEEAWSVHCLFGLFFVLGCATTPVAQYRAYHVNVSRLAQKLQSSAFIDTGVEVSPLLPPELPTFWYFGISDSLQDTFRRRGEWQPNHDSEALAEESKNNTELLRTVLDSWNQTLASLSPSGLPGLQEELDFLFHACGVLALCTVLLDAGAIAAFVFKPLSLIGPLVLLFGVATGFAAAACETCAWKLSMAGPLGTNEATKHQTLSGPRNEYDKITNVTGDEELENSDIDYLGQRYVYRWLEDCKLPNWSSYNWTSIHRTKSGFAPFTFHDGGHTDSTYTDLNGEMAIVLRALGLPFYAPDTTYHLKVQATLGPSERDMRLSEAQVELYGGMINRDA
ncbi:hypothetical protein VTJ04DRAFT_1345 [Mycothermus thermophilus]|uniref:uncharacterized protein n=1 Tax=Humicola insolens TaxID=85995 RepID=UPI00374227A4